MSQPRLDDAVIEPFVALSAILRGDRWRPQAYHDLRKPYPRCWRETKAHKRIRLVTIAHILWLLNKSMMGSRCLKSRKTWLMNRIVSCIFPFSQQHAFGVDWV